MSHNLRTYEVLIAGLWAKEAERQKTQIEKEDAQTKNKANVAEEEKKAMVCL